MDEMKKAVKNGLSEDTGKKKEEEIQTLTKRYNDKVEKLVELKEKDIMTV
jgi:ribosome recycling factor